MYLISQDKAKQLFPKDTEITHPVVLKKLHEILSARGKKVSKQLGRGGGCTVGSFGAMEEHCAVKLNFSAFPQHGVALVCFIQDCVQWRVRHQA